MDAIILKNAYGNYGEILTDVDLGSFKYVYEKNGDRSVSFTTYKTNGNSDIFDMLVNENIIQWQGQDYVIKSTSLDYDDRTVSNEIEAKHIFMEFQNHYIEKDIEDETMNSEDDSQDIGEQESQYTIEQYLEFGFKNNPLGYSYEIVGNPDKRAPVSELGNKNGLEYITEGADLFGYIYFADNKHFIIYSSESDFYKRSDEVLIYEYNITGVNAKVDTTEMKTYIKGFGKKKTKKETKNYNPIKPKDFKYKGDFTKEGTWYTTEVGASYTKTFNCKWGNERLTWTNRRMSKGGYVDVYLDDRKIGTFDQNSKSSKTDVNVISRKLSKGEHVFKVVFKGPKEGVNYKKSKPRMYVGSEKTTMLNLTAELKGKDIYHVYGDYESDNAKNFGRRIAPTLFDENITSNAALTERLKETLNDNPTVELETSYYGFEDIYENDEIRFVHKPLKFNVDLKVVKITKSHPSLNEPAEIEFSNASPDMAKIQQQINERMHNATSSIAFGGWNVSKISYSGYSDVMGSVLVND